MAEIKFNFYNVYTSYYKNINEILLLYKFKCKFFFESGFYFLWEDSHYMDLTDRFYRNKTPLYKYFADFVMVRKIIRYYIFKKMRIPRIITFSSTKIYNYNYVYLYNLIKL